MKKKEFLELKTKPLAELEKSLAESRVLLRSMEFDLAAGKTANVKDIRSAKKTIARLLTLIGESKRTA